MIILLVLFILMFHLFLTYAIVVESKEGNFLPIYPYIGLSIVFLNIYIETFKYLF